MKWKPKSLSSFTRSLISGLAAFTIPLTAVAQLEEIIVTAQKRSESLQDVPIAVSAFSGETMKALGVIDASDLVNITPGLNSSDQAGSNRNYFIRGIGTTDFHLTAASAVGQYYDGVTLTSGFHARAAMFDMDRVEILKGPQNTLFGLNTTGGAINYISNKPEIGAGTTGAASLRLGSDSLVNTEIAVGFDISDNIAARFALQTNQNDGPFTSVSDGNEYGDDDMQALRGAFLWEPNDQSSVLLNLHGMQNENGGSAVQALGSRAPDGSGLLCADFGPGVLNFESNTNCISRNGAAEGSPGTDSSTGDWDTITSTLGSEDLETRGFYLNIDYDFDWATLTFITAYDNLDFEVASDRDGGPTVGIHTMQSDDRDTFQHELRLISTGDGAFRWIGGVYYLDEEADSYTGIRSPGIGGAVLLPNVQLNHTKENLGIYFQGEYDFNDNVTLTVGLRYSNEEIVADYLPSRPNVAGTPLGLTTGAFPSDIDALVAQFAGMPGFDARGYEIARQVQQVLPNEDLGYTVKLDWKATDNSLIYASYSKGFKGGAADIRAAFALVPIPNLAAGLEDARLDPESLEAWELGYKGSFWDNRISLDAAAFHYTYNDLQQFVTLGGVPTLDNAPESEIIGLDANVKFANETGFYLDVGLSLLDSEVTEAGTSIFEPGAEVANNPGVSFSVTASQEFELANGSLLSVMANVSHTDDAVKTTLVRAANLLEDTFTQPAYTVVNANVSYRFGGEQQYGFSIFGNNLTDEHYCGGIQINESNLLLADGVNPRGLSYNAICAVTRASTRTFGASLSVDF